MRCAPRRTPADRIVHNCAQNSISRACVAWWGMRIRVGSISRGLKLSQGVQEEAAVLPKLGEEQRAAYWRTHQLTDEARTLRQQFSCLCAQQRDTAAPAEPRSEEDARMAPPLGRETSGARQGGVCALYKPTRAAHLSLGGRSACATASYLQRRHTIGRFGA